MSEQPAARRVLLLGGTSEIGLATVRALAAGSPVTPYLLGRDESRLQESLAALTSAGCKPGVTALLDATQTDSHQAVIDAAFAAAGGFHLAILAVGVLGRETALDTDTTEALDLLRVNFVGCASLMLATLRAMRAQKAGTLIVLSSVAAERPRAALAFYGAAKAGLDALAQSLGDAARADGVRVLVVRPGFVHTRMTAGLKPAPLSTTPELVGEVIVKSLAGRADTVWAPGGLRWLFAVLRALPRAVWRRMPG